MDKLDIVEQYKNEYLAKCMDMIKSTLETTQRFYERGYVTASMAHDSMFRVEHYLREALSKCHDKEQYAMHRYEAEKKLLDGDVLDARAKIFSYVADPEKRVSLNKSLFDIKKAYPAKMNYQSAQAALKRIVLNTKSNATYKENFGEIPF